MKNSSRHSAEDCFDDIQELHARGEEVIGCDAGSPAGLEGLREAAVEVHLDTDGVPLLERARCLVKSPGVPREASAVLPARKRGIPVLCELAMVPLTTSPRPFRHSPDETS